LFYSIFADILGRMLTEFSAARALVGTIAIFPFYPIYVARLT